MLVEVFGDVLCPWCYIGKRRLESALTELDVEVVWRAFELDPGGSRVPGETAAEAMAEWWGDRAEARVAQIRSLGATEGLELNLHLARPVNTFDAHRVARLAAADGRGGVMVERLLRAYHTEGLNVADPEVLRRLGVETGLDGDRVDGVLVGAEFADEVRDDRRRAVELGVSRVPTLVIDGAAPVPGVQPVEELRRLLGG